MPWRGPAYEGELPSLGWEIIETWADVLPSPRDESAPFVLTDEQALLIVEWYAIDPLSGQFVYRRGCSRRSKGVGKSPLEAAKCISELALPVRFDGWNEQGEPVGRPWGTAGDPTPWIQIASLSEDQDANTYSPLYTFLTANDGRAADALGIDAGLTRCFLRKRPGAKIEPVTSKAGSREGQPVTYGCLDETSLMTTTNGGVKLARTIRRNTTKMGGRTYETTNGFEPGEGSVAEGTHKAAESGRAGILYDALEAPTHIDGVEVRPEAPDDILRRALEVPYHGCWWVDVHRVVADIRDPDQPWEDSERFFFNWNRKGGGRAVDPHRWDALAKPREVPRGTRIGLGFDGSISQDATVLRGCTADGYSFLIDAWVKPTGAAAQGWRVPRLAVAEKVAWAFDYYQVGRMLADPPKWWTEIEGWARDFGEEVVLFFDTNQDRRMAPAVDRWLTAITLGTHTHDGDEVTTEHVRNAHKRKAKVRSDEADNRTLYTLTKGQDGGKIDGAVADVLAHEAALTMPTDVYEEEPAELASF